MNAVVLQLAAPTCNSHSSSSNNNTKHAHFSPLAWDRTFLLILFLSFPPPAHSPPFLTGRPCPSPSSSSIFFLPPSPSLLTSCSAPPSNSQPKGTDRQTDSGYQWRRTQLRCVPAPSRLYQRLPLPPRRPRCRYVRPNTHTDSHTHTRLYICISSSSHLPCSFCSPVSFIIVSPVLLLRSFFHTFSPDFLRGPSDSSSSSSGGGGAGSSGVREATTQSGSCCWVCERQRRRWRRRRQSGSDCGSTLFVNFSLAGCFIVCSALATIFIICSALAEPPMKMSVCMRRWVSAAAATVCVCVHEGAPLAVPPHTNCNNRIEVESKRKSSERKGHLARGRGASPFHETPSTVGGGRGA